MALDDATQSLLGSWRYVSRRNGQTKSYDIRVWSAEDDEAAAASPTEDGESSPHSALNANAAGQWDVELSELFNSPSEQYLAYVTGGVRVKLRRANTPQSEHDTPVQAQLRTPSDSPQRSASRLRMQRTSSIIGGVSTAPGVCVGEPQACIEAALSHGTTEAEWYGYPSPSQKIRVVKKKAAGNDLVLTIFEGNMDPVMQTAVSVGLFEELVGIWSYRSNSTGSLHAYCVVPTGGRLEWSESGISGEVEYVPFLRGAPRGYCFRVCLPATPPAVEECLWLKAAMSTTGSNDEEPELVTLYQQKGPEGASKQAVEVATRLHGPTALATGAGSAVSGITSPIGGWSRHCLYELAEDNRLSQLKSSNRSGAASPKTMSLSQSTSRASSPRQMQRRVGTMPVQVTPLRNFPPAGKGETPGQRRERLGMTADRRKLVSRRALQRLAEDDRHGYRKSMSPSRTRSKSAQSRTLSPTRDPSPSVLRTMGDSVLLQQSVEPPDALRITSEWSRTQSPPCSTQQNRNTSPQRAPERVVSPSATPSERQLSGPFGKPKKVSRRTLQRLAEDDKEGHSKSTSPSWTRSKTAQPRTSSPTRDPSPSLLRLTGSEHLQHSRTTSPQRAPERVVSPSATPSERPLSGLFGKPKKVPSYCRDPRSQEYHLPQNPVYARSDEVEVEVVDTVMSPEPYTTETVETMWAPGVVKRVRMDGTGTYDVQLYSTLETLEGVKAQDMRRSSGMKGARTKAHIRSSSPPRGMEAPRFRRVKQSEVQPVKHTLASRSRTSFNRTPGQQPGMTFPKAARSGGGSAVSKPASVPRSNLSTPVLQAHTRQFAPLTPQMLP
eukprot:TRINITY_DN12306_c2_g3_i1.p1 TRINITY_DN12306_c2_g3~~TRINITY_DN12306_c2_g3_i1.p1  ORF type:complete len:833 (+),score=173.97 TRINITY_DN12306_c2_g3_i1:36-2534(+)